MKKIILPALLILFLTCKGGDGPTPAVSASLEPTVKGELVKHTYYCLDYKEDVEQARWVYYELYPALINGTQSRTDDFRPDPAVSTGSASLSDYKGSGYDRGHLCPAADMKLNKTCMSETFFLSNMSPQVPGFNRGIWSRVEAQVRSWALEYDTLCLATGPIFKDDIGAIGANDVVVPGYYFKVIYSKKKGSMIGLVLPNASSSESLDHFVVSVDSVEELTGIDFFSGLEDEIEESIEEQCDYWE